MIFLTLLHHTALDPLYFWTVSLHLDKLNSMNRDKIIYWVSTGLMCALFLFSAGMYFTKYSMVVGFFEQLGFPTWIIYPLAVAKVLGVIAILSKQSKLLKEWAYAGFFFDALLAAGAHHYAGDGQTGMALIGILFIVVSRIYDGKLFH